MGLTIMTNELALTAQRNLEGSNNRLKSTIERLASGSRIVHASDDPAGLAISENLNAQIRSLGQAVRNAQDGVSLVQVYEGGASQVSNMLMRIRELAMQSSSDTVGERERGMLDNEVQQLKEEVQRLAKTTKFCGKELLSGETISMDFQVGVNNNDDIDRIHFNPGDTNLTAGALGIDGIDVKDKGNAQGSLELLDTAIEHVNEVRARVGAVQNRLQTTIESQQVFTENLSAAKSRIKDADIAQESANLMKETILRKAGVAVLAQANETPALALQLLRA